MSSVLKPGLFEAAMMSNFYLSLQRYIERSKNNPPNSPTVPDRFIQVSKFMHYEDHCTQCVFLEAKNVREFIWTETPAKIVL